MLKQLNEIEPWLCTISLSPFAWVRALFLRVWHIQGVCNNSQMFNFSGPNFIELLKQQNVNWAETSRIPVTNGEYLGRLVAADLQVNPLFSVMCAPSELQKQFKVTWAQFHGSAYRRILRLRSRSAAYAQAPNFCTSLVSIDRLVMRSTHAQRPKFHR